MGGKEGLPEGQSFSRRFFSEVFREGFLVPKEHKALR